MLVLCGCQVFGGVDIQIGIGISVDFAGVEFRPNDPGHEEIWEATEAYADACGRPFSF